MIEEIMDSVPPINHMDKFFESIQLPCRTDYTPKSALRCVSKYVRNPAIRDLPSPPVPEDVTSSEDLDTEMSLLELDESKSNLPGSSNPTVMGINMSLCLDQDVPADIGLLPVIYHVFEDTNTATTILLDEGSSTLLITNKMARDLGLKGKTMLTKICKTGKEFTQPIPYTHYVVDLKDREEKRHRIKCIEVPYITLIQLKPDYSKVQDMFPCIPEGSFNMPSTKIGILLGQNANALLPTGCSGPYKIEGLRICRTVLGKFGYVLDGYHPSIWTPKATNPGDSKIKILEDEPIGRVNNPVFQVCTLLSFSCECLTCKLTIEPSGNLYHHDIVQISRAKNAKNLVDSQPISDPSSGIKFYVYSSCDTCCGYQWSALHTILGEDCT